MLPYYYVPVLAFQFCTSEINQADKKTEYDTQYDKDLEIVPPQ